MLMRRTQVVGMRVSGDAVGEDDTWKVVKMIVKRHLENLLFNIEIKKNDGIPR